MLLLDLLAPHQDIIMILVARRRTYNAPFQGNLLTLGDKGMFLLTPKETRIDLPPFHGKDNVEEYLDWVAKVEQLFNNHVVEE